MKNWSHANAQQVVQNVLRVVVVADSRTRLAVFFSIFVYIRSASYVRPIGGRTVRNLKHNYLAEVNGTRLYRVSGFFSLCAMLV